MKRFDDDHYYRASDPEMRLIAKSPGSLAQMRHRGEGPPHIKVGNRVIYEGKLLNQWLEAHRVDPNNPI